MMLWIGRIREKSVDLAEPRGAAIATFEPLREMLKKCSGEEGIPNGTSFADPPKADTAGRRDGPSFDEAP